MPNTVPTHPNRRGDGTRADILAVLALHPDGITLPHLAELLGRKASAVYEQLMVLYIKGEVRRVPSQTTHQGRIPDVWLPKE